MEGTQTKLNAINDILGVLFASADDVVSEAGSCVTDSSAGANMLSPRGAKLLSPQFSGQNKSFSIPEE